MANELQLKCNDVTIEAVNFNEEELRNSIISATEKYRGLLVTEDNLKESKDDRANLNKLKKALNDARIEVKKRYMSPYSQFEERIKGIIAIVDEPILAIDSQIKNFEERNKKEKLEQIKSIYQSFFAGITSIVPFEKLFLPEFLNSNYSLKKIDKYFEEVRGKIQIDLETLNNFEVEYQAEAKAAYLEHLSVSEAMRRVNYLKDLKAKMAETELNNKMKKVAADLSLDVKEEVKKSAPVLNSEISEDNNPAEKQYTLTFKVTANKNQLMKLKEFLIKNQINYTNK